MVRLIIILSLALTATAEPISPRLAANSGRWQPFPGASGISEPQRLTGTAAHPGSNAALARLPGYFLSTFTAEPDHALRQGYFPDRICVRTRGAAGRAG